MRKIKLVICLLFISNIYSQENFTFYSNFVSRINLIVISDSKELKLINSLNYNLGSLLMTSVEPNGGGMTQYGSTQRYFHFINDKDVMIINCLFCGQEGFNYLIKGLEFKKGNYILNYNFPTTLNNKTGIYSWVPTFVLGSELDIEEDLKESNIVVEEVENGKRRLINSNKIKDFKFIEINLHDSINVELREMTKDEIQLIK